MDTSAPDSISRTRCIKRELIELLPVRVDAASLGRCHAMEKGCIKGLQVWATRPILV